MIGPQRIPDERILNASRGYLAGHRIGPHRHLLGVDADPLVDRRIGGEQRGSRADLVSRLGLEGDPFTILIMAGIGSMAIEAPATLLDG